MRAVFFCVYEPHKRSGKLSSENQFRNSCPGFFKAALYAIEGAEPASKSPGPPVVRGCPALLRRIEAGRPAPEEVTGRNSCPPPRCRRLRAGRGCGSRGSTKVLVRWGTGSPQEDRFIPPRLKEGLRRNEISSLR